MVRRSPASFVICALLTLIAMIAIIGIPLHSVSANEVGQVMVDGNLNVRNAPSTQGEIVGKLQNGDEVNILERTGEWLKISSKQVGLGFVHSDYVKAHSAKNETKPVNNLNTNSNKQATPPTKGASSNSNQISVYVNGQLLKLPIEPPIIDGRVLVPFRGIGEYLGITINWLGDTKQVVATAPEKTVIFTINHNQVFVNDEVLSINPAPTIVQDNTVIPLRFFAESYGANVQWNEKEKIVTIEHKAQDEERHEPTSPNENKPGNSNQNSNQREEDTQNHLPSRATSKAIIDVRRATVYEEPSRRSDEIGKLELGDVISVIKQPIEENLDTDDWLEIQYNNEIAYIEADSIRPIEETIIGKVNATSLNIREYPDINSFTIGSLLNGEQIGIFEIDGTWARIKHNGTWGYVHTNYVKMQVNEKSYSELADPKLDIYNHDRAWLSWSKIGSVTTSHQLLTNGVEISSNATNIDEFQNINHPAISSIEYDKSTSGSKIRIYFNPGYHFVVRHSIDDVKITLLNSGLYGKRIVVDAGHGAHDPGAKGPTGLQEKEVNLAVSTKLADLLRSAGAEVILTRSNDTFLALEERVKVAHNHDADAFVSVHSDSFKATSQGSTTFYHSGKNPSWQQSKKLSDIAIKKLTAQLGTVNRGSNDKSLHVIRETEIPAILVELAFLSNPNEEALLKNDVFRQKAAQAIFDSFVEFYK